MGQWEVPSWPCREAEGEHLHGVTLGVCLFSREFGFSDSKRLIFKPSKIWPSQRAASSSTGCPGLTSIRADYPCDPEQV
jgi:hypothetical protein